MALDKLVDSTQLNADLTSIANAIRTKGGTSASLAFPAGFVSAVEAIETGGTSMVNVASMVTSAEVNWYTAFMALNYKLKYKKSAVILSALCSSAATGGSAYTNNNYYIRHNGTTVISPQDNRWFMQQRSAREAPSNFVFNFYNSTGGAGWYYSSVATIGDDGELSSPTGTSGTVMVPAGATVILLEIPYTTVNGEVDMTLFGE